MPPNTPPRMMRLAIEFQECCLPEVGRSGGIVNQTDYNNVKGAVTAGAGSGQRRGQSSLFSPRKRPPEKSARLTPTLTSISNRAGALRSRPRGSPLDGIHEDLPHLRAIIIVVCFVTGSEVEHFPLPNGPAH